MRDGRTEILYLASEVDLAGLDRARFAPSVIATARWTGGSEPAAEELWVLPEVMAGDDMPAFILGFVESRGVEIVHVVDSRLGFELIPDLTTLARPPAIVVEGDAGAYGQLIDHAGPGADYDRLLAGRPPRPDATAAPVPEPLAFPRDPLPERSVAVVIPCFGHGRHLDACVASVRAQTLPAAQIIVVDDASPDAETRAALDRLETDVTVVRLEQHCRPSAARNRGVERATSSYVLFLDADDLLLPEAIEELLGRLEGAPDDVAFAYPNALHFGNRHDYERKPDWNLYLLTFENFCPVTSLFDARVFAAGVGFAEDLREGHEDWDLMLQIAARGARGVRAHGPTFLYRKGGFSRVDAQHLARRAYGEQLRDRHPALFDRVAEIKARWAPALSIVLLGGGEVPAGTTTDFEVLEASDAASLAAALAAARGTFVAVLAPEARPLVERRDGVEQIVRILQAADGFGVVATAGAAPLATTDEDGELVALAWRRTEASREAELGVGASLLWDLAWALEERGPLQWRALA